MVRNDIKNSSLLKTKFLIYAFNGRALKSGVLVVKTSFLEPLKKRKGNQIERQNGAKCRQGPEKRTKKEWRKAENCSKKHAFQPKISLEWSAKRSVFCKISAPKLTKR